MKLDISRLKIQLQRFLPSVISAAILLILAIVCLWIEGFEYEEILASSLYFVASMTWLFWSYNYLKESNFKNNFLFLILAILFFVGDSFYFYYKLDNLTDSFVVGHIAFWLFVVVWSLALPYLKKDKEIPLYNFTEKILGNLALGIFVFLVFWGASSLLMFSFKWLFDISFGEKAYCVACFVSMFLGYLIFIYLSPNKENQFDNNIYKAGFSKIALFVFVPILTIYLVVLYVYALKILFTLSLPKGGVSYLVSVVVAVIIILQILLFYNVNNKEENTYFLGVEVKKLLRFFAFASIPMLIFMTIGIIKRFMDYGVTAPRLYLITLNIWYYLVILYFAFKKDFRLSFVFLTFVTMFFITSIGPWNYIKLGKIFRKDYPNFEINIDDNTSNSKIEHENLHRVFRFGEDDSIFYIPENVKSFQHIQYSNQDKIKLDFDENFIKKLNIDSKEKYMDFAVEEPLKIYSLDKKKIYLIYYLDIHIRDKKIVEYYFSAFCFE